MGHNARGTHTFLLTVGSCKQLAVRVLHAAALTPASDFHKHLRQPPVPPQEPTLQTCLPAALTGTVATPDTLLMPSLWDYGCPLCPVAPTALKLQQPTKTRILPETQTHPVPPIHDLTLPVPSMGVCSVPDSASLAQPPRTARGAVASPACSPLFPWGLIPPEGQGGSASCLPPACGLQPGCEQVAKAASPAWPSPGRELRKPSQTAPKDNQGGMSFSA